MPSTERLQIEVGPPRREEFAVPSVEEARRIAVSARLSREIAEIVDQQFGVPQWLTPRQVAQRYSISETMLARMRYMRRGPRFRRVSYKVLLYSSLDIETYLQALPAGGDTRVRKATAAKDGGAKKRSKIPAQGLTTTTTRNVNARVTTGESRKGSRCSGCLSVEL